MAENNGSGGGGSAKLGVTNDTTSSSAAGIPYYEKQRVRLKDLIAKRRALEKKLVRFLFFIALLVAYLSTIGV